jgi:serine/threonine protein kinase
MKPLCDTQDLVTQITVHRLCCDFEREWRIGQRPVIESYLAQADETTRQHLLVSLLASELEIRIDRGELPERDEYQRRFSEYGAAVQRAFDDLPPASEMPVAGPASHFRIAHYRILSEIDRGGMGVVYRAVDERLGRTVALKVILAGHLASQAEIQRFEIEARAVAVLDHPGIVPVLEVGQWAGHRYLTMPLVAGDNLATLVDQQPLPARRAAELVRQMAVAIQFAHAAGIVHRDLKPGNVLLDESGRARITDFGLAKVVQPPSSCETETLGASADRQITATGQILGTPHYMSPE